MKSIVFSFVLFFLTISSAIFAQDKYTTQTGHVWFVSKASETFEGNNKTVASFLDIKTGDIALRMLVKSFKFESALLEEHFNENYMESGKFPKSDFKGKITNLSEVNFAKDGVYKVKVAGDISIHGISKPVITDGTLEVKGSQILAKAVFKIAIKDFGIEVPSVVRDKIAESFDINVDLIYDQLAVAKK